MIRSMTGYGYRERGTEKFSIKVEFKSLNGRNLEFNVRIPKSLSDREIELRNNFVTALERGSISLNIFLEKNNGPEEPVQVNTALFSKYYVQLKELADSLNASDKDIFQCVLNMPDVTRSDEKKINETEWLAILSTCKEAFEQLDGFRLKEGESIKKLLSAHCQKIAAYVPGLEQFEAERTDNLKLRIKKNLEEAVENMEYDRNRFEQEMIYYLEKLDVSEEKGRLMSHCLMFEEELNGPASGKKLGFISQEMGREINTLGSKANHAGMQQLVIAMKEELEKIKEQILNIL